MPGYGWYGLSGAMGVAMAPLSPSYWCHNCCTEADEPFCSTCGATLTEPGDAAGESTSTGVSPSESGCKDAPGSVSVVSLTTDLNDRAARQTLHGQQRTAQEES